MLRLNLLTRGLIVVGFPLVCQVAFAAALCYLLGGVQAETQKQVESRELISVSSKLVADMGAFMFSFKGSYESPETVARLSKDCAAILAEVQHVIDLASIKYTQKSELAGFCQDANDLLSLFPRWTEAHNRGMGHALHMRGYFNRETNARVKSFMKDLWNLINDEESRYEQNAVEQQQSMARIHNLFLLAAIVSVLSAVALGYIYALLVSTPIQRLTTNSTLLSQQKPLLPPLKSRDEFAALDATMRKVAASLALASANEQAMIDNVENLICSLSQDGTFTSLSPYVETILGFQPHALIGRRLGEFVIAEDLATVDRELLVARQSNQECSFELRLERKDGSVIDTLWSCFWSGSENSLFCVVNDNSEEKRIDHLKHEFMEMITDDLRTPLTSMKKVMETICTGASGPISNGTRDRIKGMIGSVDKLLLLTDDLLDSQKLQSGQMQLDVATVDLAVVIGEAAEMMRGLVEAKQLQLILKPGNCRVNGDRQKLTEVLVNLIGNAVKFTPPCSSVTVQCIDNGDTVELSVIDCGPGVPPEYRDRIFNAFEQTPTAQKGGQGVGLGLAICKLIVDAHGGTIGVTVGAQGQGSRFWFCIAGAPQQ